MQRICNIPSLSLSLALASWCAAPVSADLIEVDVNGLCPGPQAVSFGVKASFTPTGGDFGAGTGTATVRFTLENTTGLYDFASGVGNPILTGFFFNVPPGTSVAYTEALILAGSTIVSTGTVVGGVPVPAGCTVLAVDVPQTGWYQLQGSSATGQFGIFTNGVTTLEGVKAGLVDSETYSACVAQGQVYSPLVVAGRVQYSLDLGNLGTTLDSATDFLRLCTVRPDPDDASSFAGKFQATGPDGEESCFIGEPCAVPTAPATWGAIKTTYR